MIRSELFNKLFVLLLLTVFMAGCGGGDDGVFGNWLPGQPVLVSLDVTPVTAAIPITGFQQFTATATYNNGSSRDVTATSSWTSDTPGFATVSPNSGVAVGVAPGISLITANFGGMTDSATLTVTNATSMLFFVTPALASIPVSGTQQFSAIEIFSDGTSFDRTTTSAAGTASWSTSGVSAANATVGAATGLATGVTVTPVGVPVVINATFTPLVGPALVATPADLTVTTATSVSFVVTPALASTPVGGTQQFAAIETFSDGTTFDRTATSAWSTGGVSAANATVGAATGLATGVTVTPVGVPVVINATHLTAGNATPADLTVTNATPVSFEVMPALASIPVGGTQQFAAIETFSDGTTQDRTTTSAWSTGGVSAANATVGAATGLATGVTVTPVGVPVVINATHLTAGNATPADLTVTAAAGGDPGPAGAVDLLTTEPFGIIAWDAITNSGGASHIYGDVALTQSVADGGTIASVSGPATGFNDSGVAPLLASSIVTTSAGVNPGIVTAANNGTPANIAALPQLLIDLRAVYDNLMARAPGAAPLTDIASAAGVPGGTFAAATDLSGYVLSPGIYTTGATYGLSNTLGPLVLDAGGNADAVFIIRSTAAASGLTSTTGSVILQNGAQARNIFWVLNNATIGTTTFFQGTVVAGNVITLNTFANLQGRALAGALGAASGAITLSGTNVITVPE